ncbi:hypothetical protein AC249_AIPGENE7045 [Exaiptasia diaphana]|nr:hypothetical protein AC249_AIPGENE7045 [Exaiptasia diaphana]
MMIKSQQILMFSVALLLLAFTFAAKSNHHLPRFGATGGDTPRRAVRRKLSSDTDGDTPRRAVRRKFSSDRMRYYDAVRPDGDTAIIHRRH